MVRAKPDCTGQRFGMLVVLGKGRRSFGNQSYSVQLWVLQCDCGKKVEKPRRDFANRINPSCGCNRRRLTIERNKARAKPDCTGQRFGRLTVLGKGRQKPDNRNSYIQLWKVRCDCGTEFETQRDSFDSGSTMSCGCARRLGLIDNKRRCIDITGQRFGSLKAIALTGKKDKNHKPTWFLECDCGNTCAFSLSRLRHKQTTCLWINCGDRTSHPEINLWYPPTPTPYPKEAGELLIKYLHLTELDYQQIDSAVEDEKRDRLIRACWIITYRRWQGEYFSELGESRFIKKHLRYASLTVFWQRKLEQNGGLAYDIFNNKKQIGDVMTNVTSQNYPAIETQGNYSISGKRMKFKRC